MNAPLDWVKQVDHTLLALEEKPQFGNVPGLDWESFEKSLQTLFEKPSLKVSRSFKGWIPYNEIFNGIGKEKRILPFSLSPVDEKAFFVTTESDIQRLMASLLEGSETASFFYEKGLSLAFYEYFAVEILATLESLKFAEPLSFRLAEETPLREQNYYAIDVVLSTKEGNFSGRILIPDAFRKAFKHYFENREPSPLPKELREKISVDLAIEVGMSNLSLGQMEGLKTGDFVLLDLCTYDPDKRKGTALLTLAQKPMFRGRFKEGGIKITSYSVYEERSGVENMKKDFNDEDLYGDQEEEDLFKDLEEEKRVEPSKLQAESAQKISPKDLPVHLTVEVGRLHMTAEELMNLTPGNLLELDVKPEQGVDLIVNGKKVGRGELIRMGELLGVRILSL